MEASGIINIETQINWSDIEKSGWPEHETLRFYNAFWILICSLNRRPNYLSHFYIPTWGMINFVPTTKLLQRMCRNEMADVRNRCISVQFFWHWKVAEPTHFTCKLEEETQPRPLRWSQICFLRYCLWTFLYLMSPSRPRYGKIYHGNFECSSTRVSYLMERI